jgi:FkbM family methyltransferase
MYNVVKEDFTIYNGKVVPQWYRQDTNDYNTTLSILRDDEYLTKHPEMKLRDGDTFLDVGAYIGTWGALMQHLVPDAFVIAVEPLPENVALIEKNLPYPERASIIPMAATGKGIHAVKIHYGDETESGLHHNFVGTPGGTLRKNTYTSEEKFYEARGITLNQIVAYYPHIRVMKIDCEGGEYSIFKDVTAKTLAKIDYIIGEYHPFTDGPSGKQALLDMMQGLFEDITLPDAPSSGEIGHFWFKRKEVK